ncbi:MAG TPA: PKD domain-containing protein [Thermoplasmata archaeon]|nr:PKD domain-containing protein [Thermoplasmata archaeon]
MAFTWNLANSTVSSGAENSPYPLGPDRLLYFAANRTLWVAFATAPAGGSPELLVRNLTTNGTDVVTGIDNVTALADDPSLGVVFLTETLGGGPGAILAIRASNLDTVRGPVSLGGDPTDLGIDPETGNLWALVDNATTHRGSVTVLAPMTESAVKLLPVGNDPTGLAYDPAGGLGWVANSGSDNLTVLDATTESTLGTSVSLPGSPLSGALAWDNRTGQLLTVVAPANSTGDELLVIDPGSEHVVSTYATPAAGTVTSLAVDSATGAALLSMSLSNSSGAALERWDSTTGGWSRVAVLNGAPSTQAIDPQSRIDYIGTTSQVFASQVNLSSPGPPSTIDFGAGPRSGVYDAADGRVYVVNSYDAGPVSGTGPDQLDAIAPSVGAASGGVNPVAPAASSTGSGLSGVAYDPTTDRLFTAERLQSAGTVLSGASGAWLHNLSLPFSPVAVADDPVRSLVYYSSVTGEVAGFHAANLSGTGVWNVSSPATPWSGPLDGLAVDPTTGDVAVLRPDLGASSVSSLRWLNPANGSFRTVALGPAGAAAGGDVPIALAFDAADGAAYVAASGGTVFVVNETNASVVAQTNLGGSPSAVAFDAGRTAVLVADELNGTIAVFNGTIPSAIHGVPRTLSAGPAPDGLTIDPSNDQLVVSDYGSGTLDAFSQVPEIAALVPYGTAPALGQGGAPIGADDSGSPVVFHTVAGGGIPPLTYAYSGLPTGCLSESVPQLDCRPTAPGATTVVVNVSDAAGATATGSAPLVVVAAPAAGLNASPNRTDGAGRTISFLANVTGGISPYEYAVDFGDGSAPDVGRGPTGSFAVLHAYPGPGTYVATVRVVDALGITTSGGTAVEVGTSPTANLVLEGSPTATRSEGTPIQLRVTVSGGLPPYSYAWRSPNGSGPTYASDDGNVSVWNLTLSGVGPETFRVWVNDSAGAVLPLEANLTVTGANGSAAPFPLDLLVGIAAVGGAVALAAVVLVRRRRLRPEN